MPSIPKAVIPQDIPLVQQQLLTVPVAEAILRHVDDAKTFVAFRSVCRSWHEVAQSDWRTFDRIVRSGTIDVRRMSTIERSYCSAELESRDGCLTKGSLFFFGLRLFCMNILFISIAGRIDFLFALTPSLSKTVRDQVANTIYKERYVLLLGNITFTFSIKAFFYFFLQSARDGKQGSAAVEKRITTIMKCIFTVLFMYGRSCACSRRRNVLFC